MEQPALSSTLVIEDAVLERRLRRPADLARFAAVVATLAGVTLLAYVAQSTTSGISQDITQGAHRLPGALLLASSLVSGTGALLLPLFSIIDLLVRRRTRQLIESIGALLVTVLILSVTSWALITFGSDRLLGAFAGAVARAHANPFNILLSGLAAFTTVSRMMSRGRWQAATLVVLGSIALADIISGGITAAGLGASVLLGWATGLLFRYLLGTETTRPTGYEIADTMANIGHPLSLLRASEEIEAGRRYVATTSDGEHLDLVVLDRDLDGAGLATAIYRSLRLRDDPGTAGTSMRRRLDRMSLNSWAIASAGINTPHLISVAEVGPDSSVLVYEHIPGRLLNVMSPTVADAELVGTWEIVRDLQVARIAHRALTAENLLLSHNGQVYVQGVEDGVIAASDVLLRIDIAEALCTLAMLSDPHRAIAAGRVVLGDAGLARALPALQPVALNRGTRLALKANRDLLSTLRIGLLELLPEGEVEQIEIERLKPRTLLTITAGTIAAYLLLSQFAKVSIVDLFKQANVGWMFIGLGLSALTYLAATLTFIGVIPERISLWKTFQAQWAASFATLVAPPTLGSVAINIRFLSRQGLNSANAAASVAVAQALAFLSHIGLLFLMIVVAGTSKDFAFRPPRTAIIVAVIIVLIAAVLSTIPAVRKLVAQKIGPIISQVVPRMTSLANQPARLATGVFGVLLLNLGYCLCLVASVRAFTPTASIAAISLVYLAGSVVAQAAPTPGGLGAVEAALAAGLTATGIDGALALSATLLFRLWTFWIPTIPGWLAFNRLQRSGDL